MKRTTKRLLAAGIAVVLLGGAYAFLLTHPKEEDTDGETASLTSIDSDSITNIAVSLRDGEAFSIDCASDDSGTSYVMVDDADGAYDENQFSALLNTVCAVSGTLVDASSDDLENYALDDESSMDAITVTEEDGTATTLLFGLHSDTLDGTYCRLANSTDVFFVSSDTTETLLQEQTDYLSVNVLHSYYSLSSELNQLTVDALGDGTTFTIERRDTGDLTDAQAEAYSTYVITAPESCDADDSALSSGLLSDLQTGLTAQAVVTVQATDKQRSKYGLDDPTAKLTLAFDNAEKVVWIGTTDGDSTYVMCEGDDTIYDCPSSAFAFLDEGWTQYRSTQLLTYAKSQLRRAVLTADGTSYTAKLTYVEADENEEEDVDTMTGTLDGEELETEDIDRLYSAMTTLHAVSVLEEPADAEASLTLQIKLSDGTKHTLTLAKGGSREYFADVDGSGYRYTVSQTDVDTLLDAFGAAD
ncbi:MAG: DUF4340 domain-containing protein [Eubacteriales bacterium]|nr:DUF4340 domain-containing protein [Eubacteriales bacterium]